MSSSGSSSSSDSGSKATTVADDTRKAVAVVLDTGKWLAVALAAIGAAIITGLQLSDMSTIAGARLAVALAAIVVALGCVGRALWAATVILTPTYKLLAELAREPETRRALLDSGILGQSPSNDDIENLIKDHAMAVTLRRRLREEGKTGTQEYQDASRELREYNGIVVRLHDLGNYYSHVFLFHRQRAAMFGAASIATLAIIVFAIATKPPDESQSQLEPVRVQAQLFEPLRSRVRQQLGSACDAFEPGAHSEVILLGKGSGSYDVLTIPAGCEKGVRFHLRPGRDGFITSSPLPGWGIGRPEGSP